VRELAKQGSDNFTSFDSYRMFLDNSVASIFSNANDSKRTICYDSPVVAISTGYDSTATAVLAKQIGCDKAITFKEARPLDIAHFHAGEDSGDRIAQVLGLKCEEFERLNYLNSGREFPEAEIFASCHFVDLYVLSLENCLDDRSILFTGFRGDIMWSKNVDHNQDSGGPGLAEFRLRKGFLHFPLPYLGTLNVQPDVCRVSRSVRRISNSAEMASWSIGGDYDRPIPRRIVETAGVDRDLFGQTKKAVAVWYGKEKIMTEKSYHDFEAYRSRISGSEANQGFFWGLSRIKDRYRL
jgi:hypothetical protein